MNSKVYTPTLAIVIVSDQPSAVADAWAQLTGVDKGHLFPVEMVNNSLVSSYLAGLKRVQEKGKFDLILFTDQRPELGTGVAEQFQEIVGLFSQSPRTVCMDIAGGMQIKEANLPYSFVSTVGLNCFLVKHQALASGGFLNADFIYDLGAAEEFSFRQLKQGFLSSKSHISFTKIPSHNPEVGQKGTNKCSVEFAVRFFVESFGRDWDLVFASYLPYDLQGANHFSTCRQAWEQHLSDHEKNLYQRTIFANDPSETLSLGTTEIATQHHGIIRLHTVQEAVESLHPWYYYLSLGDVAVIPGVHGREPAKALDDRKKFMEKMLFDAVFQRFDFKGKTILDVGANCGFFSAKYAQKGARSYTAIEGRLQHVHQGELYWGLNSFIQGSHYEFIHANIDDAHTWDMMDARGPFDFVLCAGLLYHLPNPLHTLRMLAQRSSGVIVIDTRVSDDDKTITEPGGCSFDAIVQTRHKINPRQQELITLLESEGFTVENITAAGPVIGAVPRVDDYAQGNRVTLYAERRG